MLKSLGNVLLNRKIGLMFIDFEQPRQLRVNGLAAIDRRGPLISPFDSAQLVVRDRTRP